MAEPVFSPAPRTPLDGHVGRAGGPADAGVTLSERRLLGKLNLRGDAGDPAFAKAVSAALGAEPPTAPGTVAEGKAATILWLGPDEWLAVTEPGAEADALAALQGSSVSAVDVSDNYTVIRIAGPKARWVLAKGWAIDLHPHAFGPGRCAQGSLALANVILRQTDEAPGYELLVRPSFAKYLWDWLVDASLEVGARIETE